VFLPRRSSMMFSVMSALKSGLESGAISGCAGADGTPSGVILTKIVSQCREQARRVYYGAVFEIKEEIPIE
jgi:hypothetical protein